MKKQILNMLLTLCMLFTLLPATALADGPDVSYTTFESFKAALESGTAVNLSDCSFEWPETDESITLNGKLTLDVSEDDTMAAKWEIPSNITLIYPDSSQKLLSNLAVTLTIKGTIQNSSTSTDYTRILPESESQSTVIIANGGRVEGNFYIGDHTTLTVQEGGTVDGDVYLGGTLTGDGNIHGTVVVNNTYGSWGGEDWTAHLSGNLTLGGLQLYYYEDSLIIPSGSQITLGSDDAFLDMSQGTQLSLEGGLTLSGSYDNGVAGTIDIGENGTLTMPQGSVLDGKYVYNSDIGKPEPVYGKITGNGTLRAYGNSCTVWDISISDIVSDRSSYANLVAESVSIVSGAGEDPTDPADDVVLHVNGEDMINGGTVMDAAYDTDTNTLTLTDAVITRYYTVSGGIGDNVSAVRAGIYYKGDTPLRVALTGASTIVLYPSRSGDEETGSFIAAVGIYAEGSVEIESADNGSLTFGSGTITGDDAIFETKEQEAYVCAQPIHVTDSLTVGGSANVDGRLGSFKIDPAVELNEWTYSSASNAVSAQVYAGDTLHVTGAAAFRAGSAQVAGGTLVNSGSAQITTLKSGGVQVEAGSLTSGTATVDAVTVLGGTVTINSLTAAGDVALSGGTLTVNQFSAADLNVTGGTLTAEASSSNTSLKGVIELSGDADISGGTVTAAGGIQSAYKTGSYESTTGSLFLSGDGSVTAHGNGVRFGGVVSVSGNAKLTATDVASSAITGCQGVTIADNAVVIADGPFAGIQVGSYNASGVFRMTGGTLTATASSTDDSYPCNMALYVMTGSVEFSGGHAELTGNPGCGIFFAAADDEELGDFSVTGGYLKVSGARGGVIWQGSSGLPAATRTVTVKTNPAEIQYLDGSLDYERTYNNTTYNYTAYAATYVGSGVTALDIDPDLNGWPTNGLTTIVFGVEPCTEHIWGEDGVCTVCGATGGQYSVSNIRFSAEGTNHPVLAWSCAAAEGVTYDVYVTYDGGVNWDSFETGMADAVCDVMEPGMDGVNGIKIETLDSDGEVKATATDMNVKISAEETVGLKELTGTVSDAGDNKNFNWTISGFSGNTLVWVNFTDAGGQVRSGLANACTEADGSLSYKTPYGSADQDTDNIYIGAAYEYGDVAVQDDGKTLSYTMTTVGKAIKLSGESATSTDVVLYVDGVDMVNGSGTVDGAVYDAGTNTLTLNGAEITNYYATAGTLDGTETDIRAGIYYKGEEPLNIVVSGFSTISVVPGVTVTAYYSTAIPAFGVYADGTVNMQLDRTLLIQPGTADGAAYDEKSGETIVRGGAVYVTGDMTVAGSYMLQYPYFATFQYTSGSGLRTAPNYQMPFQVDGSLIVSYEPTLQGSEMKVGGNALIAGRLYLTAAVGGYNKGSFDYCADATLDVAGTLDITAGSVTIGSGCARSGYAGLKAGTLRQSGGTLTLNNDAKNYYSIQCNHLVQTGGTLTANKVVEAVKSTTLSGGTLTATALPCADITVEETADVTLSGTMGGLGSNITISGGTVNITSETKGIETGDLTVTGGTATVTAPVALSFSSVLQYNCGNFSMTGGTLKLIAEGELYGSTIAIRWDDISNRATDSTHFEPNVTVPVTPSGAKFLEKVETVNDVALYAATYVAADVDEVIVSGGYASNGLTAITFGGEADERISGLRLDGDGVWRYYVNGVLQSSYTGLVQHVDGNFYYVASGAIDFTYTGLVDYYGVSYYIQGGILYWGVYGLMYVDGAWRYLYNSTFASNFTGLVQHSDGSRFYVVDGLIDFSYTGLVADTDGKYYYIISGLVRSDHTGLVQHTDGYFYYVINGVVESSYTGLVPYGELSYYVQGGILYWGVYGLVPTNGAWYYIYNSAAATNYTGLVQHTDGNLYYVEDGTIDWGYTGLVWYADGNWYYVSGGAVDSSYTGLALHSDGYYYYIDDGAVDTSYTGLVDYGGMSFYVQNGVLFWGVNGLVTVGDEMYYLYNSTLASDYSGTVLHTDGKYYQVVNGVAVAVVG